MYNFIDRGAEVTAIPASRHVSNVKQTIRHWLASRRRISRVELELQSHSDRELADLGLTRADIPAVARGQFRSAA